MSEYREKPLVDERLPERFRNGDPEAFALIYTHYAESLIDFVSAKLASMDEARDLIHDLFVDIWEKRDRLRIDSSFRSYLLTASRYRVIDHVLSNIRHEYYAGITRPRNTHADTYTSYDILSKDITAVM